MLLYRCFIESSDFRLLLWKRQQNVVEKSQNQPNRIEKSVTVKKQTKQSTPEYMWTWHKKNPNKPLDADRAACPGRSPKDSSRGRWLFIRHRQAGRTLPHRIGISRRARRLAPVSRSIYRLHRGAQRTCVSCVTLEPIRAPAPRWQPAQRGLTDALRKRTDPSWSYFMPQPTHATPREASNPKSDFWLS